MDIEPKQSMRDYGHRTVTEQIREQHEPKKKVVDPMSVQVGGDHYKSMPIQPMEFSMANGLDPCQHTIIKYVTRFRTKGGVQDLEKAKHVIDMLIALEQRGKE